jgi:PAS domain S-box-containing protein
MPSWRQRPPLQFDQLLQQAPTTDGRGVDGELVASRLATSTIPRSGRIVVALILIVSATLWGSLAFILLRHDYMQLAPVGIGFLVAYPGLWFIWRVLRDHEAMQMQLHETNLELVQSRRVLRDTFEGAVAGMAMSAPDGTLLDVNQSLAQSLGLDRSDIIGKRIADFIHPDDAIDARVRLTSLLHGEVNGIQHDLRLRTRVGEWKAFSVATSLVHASNGAPPHLITQAVDIGDRKALEIELSEQQQMHRHLLEALSDMGECVMVSEGERIVWANKAYASLTGYSADELIGMKTADLTMPGSELDAVRRRRELMDAGTTDSFVITKLPLLRKDGSTLPVEGATHAIKRSGRMQRISVVRDVSDRDRWEREITERTQQLEVVNQELRDANQLKTDLVGMLSHELGQPLTTITGYSEMLHDDWDGLSEDTKRSSVQRIDQASQSLSRIVDEMLTMIRVDAGAVRAALQPVVLRKAIASAATSVRELMPDSIEIDIPDDAVVSVDASHFQQVLVNLFTNAAKYGAAPFAVTAVPKGAWLQVRVSDGGVGVPTDFIPDLFGRFTRATNDVTKANKGTGLGLFIVSNLLAASGATIHYERNEPTGSVFVMDLVAAKATQREPAVRSSVTANEG